MKVLTETLLNLGEFWRLIFSKRFRQERIARFRRMSLFLQCMELVSVMVSALVGLGVPALIIYLIFVRSSAYLSVDSCLDAGGSYNYQARMCDFETSQPSLL